MNLWVGFFFFSGKINYVSWYFIPFCIPISLNWLYVSVFVCALSTLPIRFRKRFRGNRKRVWFLNQISIALHWIFPFLFLFLFLFPFKCFMKTSTQNSEQFKNCMKKTSWCNSIMWRECAFHISHFTLTYALQYNGNS